MKLLWYDARMEAHGYEVPRAGVLSTLNGTGT